MTLITGFGPFGHVQENPSALLAAGSGLEHVVLDVSYQAAEEFVSGLDSSGFDQLLMLGVATGRKYLSLELFARNRRAGQDVHGHEGGGVEIEPGAPLLLESTLWTPEVASRAVETHLDRVQVSMDAGAYLCNYISYLALRKFPSKRVGFLHVVMPDAIALDEQKAILADLIGLL